MGNVNVSGLRDTLHKGTITSGGAKLTEPAFKRLLYNPKFKEKLQNSTYNASKLIRKIAENDVGEITERQAEAIYKAYQQTGEDGVNLKGYGEISLSHKLKGVHPRELVRKNINEIVSQQKTQSDPKRAYLERKLRGRRALEGVIRNAPIFERITDKEKFREGQLVGEAREAAEKKRKDILSEKGLASESTGPTIRPMVQETSSIGGDTASYLTGESSGVTLQTVGGPEKSAPNVAPDENSHPENKLIELEID